MAKERLALMLDRTGVTSVAILAGDPQGRERLLEFYAAIQGAVDAFDREIGQCFTQDGTRAEITPTQRRPMA